MARAILFLTTPDDAHNDNHERLPALFAAAGWHVTTMPHDALYARDNRPWIDGVDLRNFNLIWPVGFGRRETYLDRVELLAHAGAPLISKPRAVMALHGKLAWLDLLPETHAAGDPEVLARIVAGGGEWVLKPNAGSLGRDVYRVSRPERVVELMGTAPSRYWLLQRFLGEISEGETRTLVCGANIIGSYLRVPDDGLRANLAAQGQAKTTHLNEADAAVVAEAHQRLVAHGIGFAAIDTVAGHLMEVNVANPGGLQTLMSLYPDAAIAERLVAAVC